MALGEGPPSEQGEPYSWENVDQPSQDTRRLWQEVATGIDKSSTVVWKNAVDSLDHAYRHLHTSEEARRFVEQYMKQVISILLGQQPAKIGHIERSCVEDSLERAILIIAEDIHIQLARKAECRVLEVLAMIFNRKKTYYKGNRNANLGGLPEVRLHMIERFRGEAGFSRLAEYLSSRFSTPMFPSLDFIHQILSAISEAVPNRAPGVDPGANAKEMEKDAILVSRAVMDFIGNAKAMLEDNVAQLKDEKKQLEKKKEQVEDDKAKLEDNVVQLKDEKKQLQNELASVNESKQKLQEDKVSLQEKLATMVQTTVKGRQSEVGVLSLLNSENEAAVSLEGVKFIGRSLKARLDELQAKTQPTSTPCLAQDVFSSVIKDPDVSRASLIRVIDTLNKELSKVESQYINGNSALDVIEGANRDGNNRTHALDLTSLDTPEQASKRARVSLSPS